MVVGWMDQNLASKVEHRASCALLGDVGFRPETNKMIPLILSDPSGCLAQKQGRYLPRKSEQEGGAGSERVSLSRGEMDFD